MRTLVIILWLLALVELRAAQTLLKRSMFVPPSMTNVCDISATNLLGFDSVVTGSTWPVIAIGATTNGQGGFGYSGWVKKGSINAGRWTNLVANTFYQASCWFRLHQFSTPNNTDAPNADTSSFASRICTIGRGGDIGAMNFGVAGAGSLWCQVANGATTNIAALKINQWYYFACAWRTTNTGVNVKDARVYLGTLGSAATNIYSFDGVTANNVLTWCEFGFSTGTGYTSARMTGCSLHTLSAGFADAGIPTDINPPSSARASYYINPATGSDLNSGAYITNAWQTGFRLYELLHFGGAMGGLVPWVYTVDDTTATPDSNPWAWNRGVMDGSIHATGDKILLDTSSAVLRTTNCVMFMTNNVGVELGSANAAPGEIRPWVLLSGTWTQYDAVNFPNIWQIANTGGKSNIVVWEDQKWMNNPTNLSGLVNLTTNLNSTPGSFWTDTTNVYVHPFGSTNPNSDGKTYERSDWIYYNIGTPTLAKYHAAELFDNGSYWNNVKLWGTVYRDQYNGNWDSTYTLRLANNGPSVLGNVDLRYGAIHVYGGVNGSTTLYRFNFNSIFQQCAPWDDVTGTSGHGNEVEFPSTGVGTRQAYFWNCNAATNSVIGSTTGSTSLQDGFFSHESAGPYEAYSAIHYFNCVGAFICADAMVASGGLVISNCVTTAGAHLSVCDQLTNIINAVVVRTIANGPVMGSGVTMKDSIVSRADNLNQNLVLSGPWTFDGVTFDARASTNTASDCMIIKTDGTNPITLSVSNSLILLPNTAADITFVRYKSTDTLNFNNNVFLPNAQNHVTSDGGSEKTWAQWQALGYDSASSTNNPAIGPGYRPYSKTPLWNVATDRGASIDFTGKLFQSRRTAGAYEYDPPWMMLP